MPATEQDIIGIRHSAQQTHEQTKLVLDAANPPDLEQHRDLCIEQKNAAQSIVDDCETSKDELRRQKRQLDDAIAEVNVVQREFKALKEDLDLDARRCTNLFWDKRREQKSSSVSNN